MAKVPEKGRPLSLENAYTCRDAVATLLIAAQNRITIMTAVIPVAALTDPVELKKTWIKANPVWNFIASSISLTQKA